MGELNVLTAAIIIVAGILAGFINTLAGGGSFLTLAALDLAGLPKVMPTAPPGGRPRTECLGRGGL